MIRVVGSIFLVIGFLMAPPFSASQADTEGSKDYPGISRMPGYYIAEYQESPFDTFTFTVMEGKAKKEQAVEGRRYDFRYNLKDGAAMPSELQVVRNFQNAARSAGGQVLFDSPDETTLRLNKDGKAVWVAISVGNAPSGRYITMNIIEKEAMKQEVMIDASGMARDIAQTGRVAIYGIQFDTGKSELKPESAPALAEMIKLLNENPALKIYIVGHTDMVGDLDSNLKLSQARAQAVLNALVGQGIAPARMKAYGDGPYAPVASNKDEEGRAKNRRVELVEIATR
jgi:outer membrane protein OmpA-like peptidoglycan-associated protein